MEAVTKVTQSVYIFLILCAISTHYYPSSGDSPHGKIDAEKID